MQWGYQLLLKTYRLQLRHEMGTVSRHRPRRRGANIASTWSDRQERRASTLVARPGRGPLLLQTGCRMRDGILQRAASRCRCACCSHPSYCPPRCIYAIARQAASTHLISDYVLETIKEHERKLDKVVCREIALYLRCPNAQDFHPNDAKILPPGNLL
ncbi:hypothetical protein PR048_002005 [Dryococelus australis]|uniref:Uncharacterized protein n=1 Tax=Dryococelus australis TaxID=614101 RepID=A0ABQ9IK17_9NEOP|nr:hypothetical protein PR048_002005 [Dryococelus australis]